MNDTNRIIEAYKNADFEQKLYYSLSYRSPRNTFAEIDHRERQSASARRMCHGYLQRIRDLVLPEFIRRVETVAFEHRLYRDKPDWIVAGACLRHFH